MRLRHIQVPERRSRRKRNTRHAGLRSPRSAQLRTNRRANRHVVSTVRQVLEILLFFEKCINFMYSFCRLQVHWSTDVCTVDWVFAVRRRHQTGNILQHIAMQTRFSWRSISGHIRGCHWSHEKADGEKPQVSCRMNSYSNIIWSIVLLVYYL